MRVLDERRFRASFGEARPVPMVGLYASSLTERMMIAVWDPTPTLSFAMDTLQQLYPAYMLPFSWARPSALTPACAQVPYEQMMRPGVTRDMVQVVEFFGNVDIIDWVQR